MVNLKAKPYNLSEEDIKWVEETIANMTDEEKVGQLFWQLTGGITEDYLKELMEKYHLGGCRYNGMPGQMVLNQNRILQKYAKIPTFIACIPFESDRISAIPIMPIKWVKFRARKLRRQAVIWRLLPLWI